jgi:hypothetical protein
MFCERVRAVLERGAMLQLPHVLVKLTLLPHCAHIEALKSCVPRRAGDVFTADAAHLYVFLFACRLADADAALARIFDVPVERIADDIAYLAEQSIGDELNALATASRRTPIADYSDLLAAPLRHQTTAPVTAAQAATVSPVGAGMSAVAQLVAVEQALEAARVEVAPRRAEPYAMPLRKKGSE